jgi:hypothetical protein
MSEANVQIWQRSLEGQLDALAVGTNPEATIAAMAEIWDPDIELDATDAPALDLNHIYRGADAVRQFWLEWFSAWETVQYDYELLDAGERVVMLLDLKMRGRASGIEMPAGKIAWTTTFRNGLATHVKLHMSQAEALEAAGLSA